MWKSGGRVGFCWGEAGGGRRPMEGRSWGLEKGDFRTFILKSVSKKTTHTGYGAREVFPRFFLSPYSVKFIFYGIYYIIKMSRGTDGNGRTD